MKPSSESPLRLFWHEPSNFLAIADISSDLVFLTIIDDDYDGMNPFYAWPQDILKSHCGWLDIGEL